jgi:predicted nucleic acid-binding protein
MTGKGFVDTNVLVYAHDSTAGEKHRRAVSLVTELWENGSGCLSLPVLQDFYMTVTQKVPTPMEAGRAVQIMRDLAIWTVHEPGIDDVIAAVEMQLRYGISFRDAMILRSAVRLGCETVWSEDLNPGQVYDGVRVQNPFA